MTNGKSYRVGLIGAGNVSEFHIKALKRLPNVRVVGITDIDGARARATAQRFGIASHPSLKVMAAEGLDVVHVLTPPDSHVDVALEALSLGCHVLVESPLAKSVEDCERLIAESRSRNLRVCANHCLLGDPRIKRALKLVQAGAIGDVLTVDYVRSSSYPPYRGGRLPPYYGEGGYQFRDLGAHALYLLREFLGNIEDVQADFRTSGLKDSDPNIHFDEWRALVRCAKGTGSIQLSWNVKPLQHQLIVQGSHGTLRADLGALSLTRRRQTRLPKPAERVVNAVAETISSAAQMIWNAARFGTGQIQSYRGLRNFIGAFYESLATNHVMPAGLEAAREIVYWTEQVAGEADHAKAKFHGQYQPGERSAVVVTGANGLLGRAFVKRLIQEDEYIRLFVRRLPPPEIVDHPQIEVVLGDLGDPEAVDRAFEGATAVFHLGAAMNGAWAAHEAATITGTRNVVEACLKYEVPKLIYISSLEVIDWAGHPAKQPVTESASLEPTPRHRGYYAQAKLEAERIVRTAAQERGLPAVVLRPGQIWADDSPLITGAVGLRIGRWLAVLGDNSNLLPLVHVNDVVEAIVLATQSPFSNGEVFQVVDNELMSREELVGLYLRAREPQLRVARVPLGAACFLAGGIDWLSSMLGRPTPISPYRLRSAVAPLVFDCSRARDQLGWEPHAHSRDALRKLLTSQ